MFGVLLALNLGAKASAADERIMIRPAVELRFDVAEGVTYELQSSTDLLTWTTEETVDDADDGARFRSTAGEERTYYRLLALPKVSGSLPSHSVSPGEEFTYVIPEDVFTDPDGGALIYHVTLSDGGLLPSWLSFDGLSRTFTGMPTGEDAGGFNLKVTAENAAGGRSSLVFSVTVTGGGVPEFVLIPAGAFSMGDHFDEGFSDERPVHSVSVSEFLIKSTEVTKSEWDVVAAWAASNGYDISTSTGSAAGADHPVSGLSWLDCAQYCNARSEMEGLDPVYEFGGAVYRSGNAVPEIGFGANGYRLPTEAEWEKAARGGLDGRRFPQGDTISHADATYYSDPFYSYDISPTAEFHPTHGFSTAPVASFPPNGYGLYDVAGNVWEWCSDWASEDYYSSSPAADPAGPAEGDDRIVRGGAYFINANLNRVAYRSTGDPTGADGTAAHGFRPARTAP